MCIMRFFLFSVNCTLCGICCVSEWYRDLTMSVNIVVLAIENLKSVP